MFNFKKVVSYVVAGLTVAFTLSTQEVHAATAVLQLKVTGSIAATPRWEDSAGNKITELIFAFSGISSGDINSPVVSGVQSAKLANALSTTPSVGVVRPAGCSIGSAPVSDSHVFLVHGSSDVTGGTITLSADMQNFSLKFGPGYGDKSGTVSCANEGSLTYTY